MTSMFTPRTALGTVIQMLTFVGTPYIAFLAALLISELLMLIPLFSQEDHREWIVELTFILSPMLFLPVSVGYLLASGLEDHLIPKLTSLRAMLYGLMLSVCIAASWYGAAYLGAYVETVISFGFPWTVEVLFVLNLATFIPLVFGLYDFFSGN